MEIDVNPYLAMPVETPDKESNDGLFENAPCKSNQASQTLSINRKRG